MKTAALASSSYDTAVSLDWPQKYPFFTPFGGMFCSVEGAITWRKWIEEPGRWIR